VIGRPNPPHLPLTAIQPMDQLFSQETQTAALRGGPPAAARHPQGGGLLAVATPPQEAKRSGRIGYSACRFWVPLEGFSREGLFEAGRRSVTLQWFDGYLDRFKRASTPGQLDCQQSQGPLGGHVSVRLLMAPTCGLVLTTGQLNRYDQVTPPRDQQVADLKGQVVAAEGKARSTINLLLLASQAGRALSDRWTSPSFARKPVPGPAAPFVAAQGGCVAACLPPSPPSALKRSGRHQPCLFADFPGAISDTWSCRNEFREKTPKQLQNVWNRLVRHPR